MKAGTAHHDKARLRDISKVIIDVIGQVRSFCPKLVTGSLPPKLHVKRGIRLIVHQFAGGLSILITKIATHTILPAKAPRGFEATDYAVVQRCHELMAEILHGVVRFVERNVITPTLMDKGIAHCQALQRETFGTEQLVEPYRALHLNPQVVEVEIVAVKHICGGEHNPVYEVFAVMIEAFEG